MSLLSAWANFYVVVGTSAGALVGLTFVVISLVAGRAGQAVRPGLSSGLGRTTRQRWYTSPSFWSPA